MKKKINKKQWAILLIWWLGIGVMHHFSDPVNGLIGTIVTVFVIALVTLTFLIHVEDYEL